jgi:hypothetical protein
MPFQSSESLDDQIVLDGSNGFPSGVITATRPDGIPATSLADAVNMDYDDFGNLVTRYGAQSIIGNSLSATWESIVTNWEAITSYWGSSLPTDIEIISGFYFDTAASERIVIAGYSPSGATRQLYVGNPTTSFGAITGSSYSSSAEYVYFAQLNEKLYYSDGVGSLKYINSSNANASITAGKVSRVDVINEGNNHSTISTITFTAPPSGVTATGVAVVSGNGNLVAIEITNPGSGYTTAPSITISPANGSHAVAYISLAAPAKPIYLVSHTQRLFCASADTTLLPDTLYFSDILDGESWDPAGSVRIGGDGDPITGLFSWFGFRLLVLKERSIWYVDANPSQDPADWEIGLVSGNIGCVSHRSIVGVGADVLFLSRDGVRSLAQIQAGTQTDVGLPISAPIKDIVSKINRSKLHLCDAVSWNNRYLLAVPLSDFEDLLTEDQLAILTESDQEILTGSANANNCVLVYHLLAKAWIGYWTNWSVSDFIPTSFSSNGPILMWGGEVLTANSGSGQVWSFSDYLPNTRTDPSPITAFFDSGYPYESRIITKAYNFNEPIPQKTGYNVQFALENQNLDWTASFDMAFSTDMGKTFTTLESNVDVGPQELKFLKSFNLISRGRWNNIQFKLKTSTGIGGRMMPQSITTSGFLDSIRPEQ